MSPFFRLVATLIIIIVIHCLLLDRREEAHRCSHPSIRQSTHPNAERKNLLTFCPCCTPASVPPGSRVRRLPNTPWSVPHASHHTTQHTTNSESVPCAGGFPSFVGLLVRVPPLTCL